MGTEWPKTRHNNNQQNEWERGKMGEKHFILKSLVGSRGYGVHGETADYDYRGVYVLPTEHILSLSHRYKGTHWVEGKDCGVDDTAYEIGHFLHLASKCNPTILNTLKAPIVEADQWGKQLRELFPAFIDMKRCYDAFIGYGLNQRKKMLHNKDDRWQKYGAAYTRQLWYLTNLFKCGDYKFVITGTPFEQQLYAIKKKQLTAGQIIDLCNQTKKGIDDIIENNGWPKSTADPDKINTFLLKIRAAFWMR